ncbi:MFS transporter [Candidatus Bathyarchaeota archaeon]|nr:MFS transporter [Candidatus Bathyarchaeota archaeon]
MINKFRDFWQRQSRNYKVFLARGLLDTMFAGSGVNEYWNIFITRLGATSVELGIINSISHAIMALLALPSGWLTDHSTKMKKLYLYGRGLQIPTPLLRFLAQSWPVCLVIDIWQAIAQRLTGPPSQIIWISSLKDSDRVRGISFHRVIISIAGVIAPLISAYIVTYFGGLDSADNIRPLFLLQFFISIVTFLLISTQMREVSFAREANKQGVYGYFYSVLDNVPGLKLLLLRQCVMTLVSHMRMPFSGIYMVDVKGASAFILGWRGTVSTLIGVLFSMAAGQLADRYGRRKLAYISRVFWWASILVTIFTPLDHPEYLILAGLLQGIQTALFIGWTAFIHEYIPLEVRGRWNGISMLTHGIIGTVSPILGGLIWNINPDYIWWINLIGDVFFVLPLMIMIPDRDCEITRD